MAKSDTGGAIFHPRLERTPKEGQKMFWIVIQFPLDCHCMKCHLQPQNGLEEGPLQAEAAARSLSFLVPLLPPHLHPLTLGTFLSEDSAFLLAISSACHFPMTLSSSLWYFCLHFPLFASVYVCGMHECVCACLLVCVPEVNVKGLPQLLFMLYIEGNFSLIF